MTTDIAAVRAMVEQLKPLFDGKDPGVQGGALAELFVIWLAGLLVIDDPAQTKTKRAEILSEHLLTVEKLVNLADARCWKEGQDG